MNRKKIIKLTFLAFFFALLISQNASFSQSKKKQIEALNFKIDSVNQVIAKERITQKTIIGSLEIQESISKQKVDSLTNEIKTIENQISSQQKKKQKKELEIGEIKTAIDRDKDSFNRLIEEENKTQTNFNSVVIGTQTWMAENLNVSTFRNGDPIPEAKTNEEWVKAGEEGKPAWCYYNNDPINGIKYGKLYNWYAVSDSRGLSPDGWHVSNLDDWNALDLYNNKTNLDKINFKSICGGTLSVEEGGFTFSYLNFDCEFWTSTDLIVDIVSSKLFCVYFFGYSLEEDKIIWSFSEPKNSARYVRCVKD
jgi:uncharacterized protein (TIGR02145 family)